MASTPSLNSLAATQSSWWQRQTLRTKATLLAIMLGTAPVLGIGAIAYQFANQSFTQQIQANKKSSAIGIADKVNRFMADRYGDIQVLSSLPIIKNPKVRAITTLKDKETVLNRYLDAYLLYDSVAVFDLKGDVMFQSLGTSLQNARDQIYFQQALNSGLPFIAQPEISKVTGKKSIFFSAPIKDSQTQQTIAIVRVRMPVSRMEEVVRNFSGNGDDYYLMDKTGKIFLSSNKNNNDQTLNSVFASYAQIKSVGKPISINLLNANSRRNELFSYSPVEKLPGLPLLGWDAAIVTDPDVAFKPQAELLRTLLVGTAVTALLVALLAAYLANRATRPIIQSAEAVDKIGKGNLNTRVLISGQDEIATLGANINLMAEQIQDSLRKQEEAAQAQLESQAEIARQQEESTKAQLSAQVELARQQEEAATQAREKNEALQMELLTLLQDVEGASSGDLTVRADVSAGEIGIVADFFNAIVENLRDIVSQVKQASAQVNNSVGSNEIVMGQLAEESQSQVAQITDTLQSVERMALSIQEVAENARMAATVSEKASKTAELGGKTMDRTVDSILELRETVAETAKKVKRLGESSQQISKAVSLINQIALQTNLLAINASIEAARAGEEGRGFAVVAEEVGALAAQSASATKEIEAIVETIQRETSEVVDAMESGTSQVVEGTRQVAEAKENLGEIVKVSREIDELLQSISSATVSQTETSQLVKRLMEQITQASQRTSNTSRQVSTSLQETVNIAQQLQASVETFKVEA